MKKKKIKKKPKILIIDVDGVLTTGQFLYTSKGKVMKIFGPHDNDGLKLIKDKIKLLFVTADKVGFSISKKRITEDMGFDLVLVNETDRYDFLNRKFNLKEIIYIGDGIHDAKILKECLYGIAPINARIEAKKCSNFITKSESGKGAVLDACLNIDKKFFKN